MSSACTPIKAFSPRKRLESDRLESLRAKIIKESSNLYKLPSSSSASSQKILSTTTSPTKAFEQSRIFHNTVPVSSPALKQEEMNREHVKKLGGAGRSKLGHNLNDSLPSIEWEHPELSKIEKRIVNKELESKKVMINLILLLSSNLVYNSIELVWKKFIMEFFELSSNIIEFRFKNLLIGFQLLFLLNIINGMYKVLKPQDQFTDLQLTPHQRELLGLPQVPTVNSSFEVIRPTSTVTTSSSTTLPKVEKDEKPFTLSPKKSSHTPLASPMASPSKSFSPKKSVTPHQQQVTSKPVQHQSRLSQLKNQEIPKTPASNTYTSTTTPTYIPSPKYYYRMDSPSRTRRRPL